MDGAAESSPAASALAPSPSLSGRLWLLYGLGLALALPIYLLLATERFDTLARLLAWLGLGLALLPTMVLLTRPASRSNSVAVVGLTIALFYQLAPFHERTLLLRWGEARISQSAVTLGQLLSALATPAIWLGWALAGRLRLGRLLPQPRLVVSPRLLRWVGAAIVLLSALVDVLRLGGDFAVALPLQSLVSLLTPSELGFSMVLLAGLRPAGRRDRLWFWALFGTAAALALSRGIITVLIKPLVIYLLGVLYVRRRVVLWPLLLALVAVVLLQPVKGEFRAKMWDRQVDAGLLERAGLYVELVSRHWLGSELDRDTDKEQSVRSAAARTAGALALANVIELTPSAVPYQWGKTYRYLRYALVPRFLAPEKPIAQYADVWASVMYGYTTIAGTAHVMVGLGQLSESYINFGMPLCLLWLLGCGGLLRAMDEIFAHRRAGSGALALHLFYLQGLLFTFEGSLAQFWGGLAQQFALYALALALLGRLGRGRLATG